jgi:hypothetical protein
MDGGKAIILLIIAVLSFGLALAMYSVANHYSLTTPGTFIAEHFFQGSTDFQHWGPGNGIFVEILVDVACWFAILSGVCWIIGKLRS